MRVGVVHLGLERLPVVITHPLIAVKDDNLHRGFRIIRFDGASALVVENILNLGEGESSGAVGARTRVACGGKGASGCDTRSIIQSKAWSISQPVSQKQRLFIQGHNKLTSSIETKTHDHLGRINVISPQKVHGQGNFCQVGVCVYNRADPWVFCVPCTVYRMSVTVEQKKMSFF